MALGTPVAGAAAYSAQNGTSVAPAYPSGILATDAVILFVGQKPSTANGGTVTTPTGWTLRDELTGAGGYGTTLGADTGNTNLRAYTWDSPVAGQTGTLSVTLGTNNVSWAFIVRVPSNGGALSYGSADGQRTTTPTSPMSIALTNGATATNFQTGDVAIWAMCIPTDVTTPNQFSAQDITATGAVFGTPVELNEPDSQTGNDIGGYSAWDNVDSGSSTTAPTVVTAITGTLTNVRGPVVLLRVREAPVTHAATGDLVGDIGSVSGSADRQAGAVTHAATGALTGDLGEIVGSAARTRAHASTGTLTGQLGAVAGSAARTRAHTATGALTGDIGSVAGAADRQSGFVTHDASGALTGPGSAISGSAARSAETVEVSWLEIEAGVAAHDATGALTGPGAAVAGSADRTRAHPSSGALSGPGSAVAGSAARTRAHASTGALQGPESALAGTAARTRAHASTGILAGDGATLAGTASRSGSAVTHDASGSLVGLGAVVTGEARGSSRGFPGFEVDIEPATWWTRKPKDEPVAVARKKLAAVAQIVTEAAQEHVGAQLPRARRKDDVRARLAPLLDEMPGFDWVAMYDRSFNTLIALAVRQEMDTAERIARQEIERIRARQEDDIVALLLTI